MYSDNTQTLMTSAEFREVLASGKAGMLDGGGIIPSVEYMGVKYKVGDTVKVYDGDHATGNYYFKTSDGMVKVNIYGTPADVDQNALEAQINTLAEPDYASDFEYLECMKSQWFDPLFMYKSNSPVVGKNSLVMGDGSVCEGENCLVDGICMYVKSGAFYDTVTGTNSVIDSGCNFMNGAVSDTKIASSQYNAVYGADNIITGMDASVCAGYGSRITRASYGDIRGQLVMKAPSQMETAWCDAMGYKPINGFVDNYDVHGMGNAVWGAVNGIVLNGDGNSVGWFNQYIHADIPSRSTMTRLAIDGNSNWIGFNSNSVVVKGCGNYVAACSDNVFVFGNGLNMYKDIDEGSLKKCAWVEGEFSYPPMNSAEAAEKFARAELAESIVLVGKDNLTYSKDDTTWSIVQFPSGISPYVRGCDYTAFDGEFLNEASKSVGGTFDVEYGFLHKKSSALDEFPVDYHNVLAVGDNITLPTGTRNTAVVGNDVVMPTATVSDSMFFTDNMFINGPAYMRVNDETVRKNIIHGVWWIDTFRNGRETQSGLLSSMNADDATQSFTDAFVFINSKQMYSGRFFGTVEKGEATDALGFGEADDSTITGSGTFDGITGYIYNAAWHMCKKPDTPMVYTGGIALYGGHMSSDTGYQSDYGVLKLGNRYYQDYSTPPYDYGYSKEQWQRDKTLEAIRKHINGDHSAVGGSFDNAVVMATATEECPYAGLPLVVQQRQELDGSFHIGVGKLNAANLCGKLPSSLLDTTINTYTVTIVPGTAFNNYVEINPPIPENASVLMTVDSHCGPAEQTSLSISLGTQPGTSVENTLNVYSLQEIPSARSHNTAIMFNTDREYKSICLNWGSSASYSGSFTAKCMVFKH